MRYIGNCSAEKLCNYPKIIETNCIPNVDKNECFVKWLDGFWCGNLESEAKFCLNLFSRFVVIVSVKWLDWFW